MKRKKILGTIAFFTIVILIFAALSSFFSAGDPVSVANIKGFYKEPENSLDVVLVGPSEFYSGYSATLAWEEFGYTSYSLAVAGVPGNLYKSMTAEVLKRQDPKLIVFELNGFLQKDTYLERTAQLHTWIDNIPWSDNKIQTIEELIPEEEQYSYYCNMATYHENWKDLGKCFSCLTVKSALNLTGYSYTKGFGTYSNNCEGEDMEIEGDVYFTEKAQYYMEDLLQYCNDMGLENVLFVRFPHAEKISNPQVLDDVETMIAEYGYDYLNMNEKYSEIGLDLEKDFYDKEHLNVHGMKKNTEFFGEYICERYNLKGTYSDELVERWDLCAKKTGKLLNECEKDIQNGDVKRYFEFSIYKRTIK